MRIINPEVQWLGEAPTSPEAALSWIERAGRTCYKSEEKIGVDSAEKFFRMLVSRGHTAMIEHSNFVAKITFSNPLADPLMAGGAIKAIAPYLAYHYDPQEKTLYAGGNLRAWYDLATVYVEEGLAVDCSPMLVPFVKKYGSLFDLELKSKNEVHWVEVSQDKVPSPLVRLTFKFICDRGVSHELVRHRPCSFAQESTRYVNYKEGCVFIRPYFADQKDLYAKWLDAVQAAEHAYIALCEQGASPQAARAVLPNSLKTEVVVTCDLNQLFWILHLRDSPAAHPDFRLLAKQLRRYVIQYLLFRGWCDLNLEEEKEHVS